MATTQSTIRILTTSPAALTGGAEDGLAIAQSLAETFTSAGVSVDFAANNFVKNGRSGLVIVIHNGPDAILPGFIQEARRIGDKVVVSWSKPLFVGSDGKSRFSELPLVASALSTVDGIQVWSDSVAEAFGKSHILMPQVKIIGQGKTFGQEFRSWLLPPVSVVEPVSSTATSPEQAMYDVMTKRVSENPEDLIALIDLISVAGQVGRFDFLGAALKRYNASHPGNPDLIFTEAVCAFELNKYSEAQTLLNAVVALDPEHSDAISLLASLPTSEITIAEAISLRNSGKIAEAAEKIDQILSKDPLNGDALRELALCLAISGNYESAAPLFLDAVRRNPSDKEAISGLVYSSRANGKMSQLTAMLEKTVTPSSPIEQKFAYTQCLVETGSLEKAREQLRSLDREAPRDRRTYVLHSLLGN